MIARAKWCVSVSSRGVYIEVLKDGNNDDKKSREESVRRKTLLSFNSEFMSCLVPFCVFFLYFKHKIHATLVYKWRMNVKRKCVYIICWVIASEKEVIILCCVCV